MKIAVVTGTRAEYGIWCPVLNAIEKAPGLALQLVVTGMHLQKKFGHTIDHIKADGRQIAAAVPMYRTGESPARGLSRGTAGLAAAFAKLNPDVVMVLGDRLEILAAATAALTQHRIIAHLHGGETAPGQYDEQIRHAVTKMAHLHFCATKVARRRIVQMGEDPRRVHVVGAPAIDSVHGYGTCYTGKPADRQPTLLLHPTSPDAALERSRALMLIDLLLSRFEAPILAVYPNNDPGHQGILSAYAERAASLDLASSRPQYFFWKLLVESGLLVGNSSSGILEAATLGCAVVNIGDRQAGRERSGNVLDVSWKKAEIARALDRVLSDAAFHRLIMRRRNVYGDGRAAGRIAGVLKSLNPKTFPRTKRFVDLPR